MTRRKDNLVTLAVVAAIAIFVAVVFLGPRLQSATAGETTTRTAPAIENSGVDGSTDAGAGSGAAADFGTDTVRFSDGPYVTVAELPDEAFDTLLLIDSDGPFPYSKDGTTFQNREGLLPDHDRGYYREYTVDTPGLDHRGARRIVGGAAGDLWYTGDHYESFSEIIDW